MTKALDGRYDIARAERTLENARTDVEFLSNQRLPDVRLETSYRGSGLAGTEFLRSGGFPGCIIGSRRREFWRGASALGNILHGAIRSRERRADRQVPSRT